MTDLAVYRVYEPHELGTDGYPLVWHSGLWLAGGEIQVSEHGDGTLGGLGVKHLVRAEAGGRCLRCGHPFVVGVSGTFEDAHPGQAHRLAETGDQVPLALFAEADPEYNPLRGVRVNWSPCDERCTHSGPVRWRAVTRAGWNVVNDLPEGGAGPLVAEGNRDVQAAWRILTVHHLNERKHDLRWWNLAALCQRCHLYVQRKVQMERVYPWEHSDWFKPFAAGWYAYAYLGENLTREQALERQDELLGLERVA